MDHEQLSQLVQAASAAKTRAMAPYSGFHVGAAIRTPQGRIYSGNNIEVSSYSLTICAERLALFKALSEGEQAFEAIAVATDSEAFCPPCGACRQVLMDFTPDITVILVNVQGQTRALPLRALLPEAFTSDFLDRHHD